MSEPRRTVPEALDEAETGEEWAGILTGWFDELQKARDKELDE